MRAGSGFGAAAIAVATLLTAFQASAAVTAQEPLSAPAAQGERRVALVIGNGAYSTWTGLNNADDDARRIRAALTGAAGFEVVDAVDADVRTLREKIAEFAEKAAGADVAMVYYSGHGFEFEGANYLVPVDAPQKTTRSLLRFKFVDMQEVLDAAAGAKAFRMLFLDACRTADQVVSIDDNDGQRSAAFVRSVGLVDLPQSVVFYATAKGKPAYDAAGPGASNSPFAESVARAIETPGLELSQVFKVVAEKVWTDTAHLKPRQQPFQYGSWYKDFYFRPPETLQASFSAPVEAYRLAASEVRVAGAEGGASVIRGAAAAAPAVRAGLDIPTERLSREDGAVLAVQVLAERKAEEVRALAEAGDPVALYMMSFFQTYGIGLQRDPAAGRVWLEKAAATGHPAGQALLGYQLMDGGREDRVRALDLFEKASAQGYAKAKSQLGHALITGSLGKTDRARGMRLLREAADAGHLYALFALARYGEAAEQIPLLEKAEAQGLPSASDWLCRLRTDARKPDLAVRHCEAGATAGHAGSMVRLSEMYARGQGVAKSADEARYWLRLALGQPVIEAADKTRAEQILRGLR
ncbi:MAG TPA: caspase family protein [Caulobacteraceae bacterium]|nr:caspase family protein [Caulobacteraceae bacterium]